MSRVKYSRRYNAWQRSMFRLADACGIRMYALLEGNQVQPTGFYGGWRYKVQKAFSVLIWGPR